MRNTAGAFEKRVPRHMQFRRQIAPEQQLTWAAPTTHREFFRSSRLAGEVNPPYAHGEKTPSRRFAAHCASAQ